MKAVALLWSVLLCTLACAPPALLGGVADLPQSNAVTPIEVTITGDYTEGIVVDHAGNLYFSHGKIISKIDTAGQVTTFAETGEPNGHKIKSDGSHLVCDASRHAVLHLDATGKERAPAAITSDGENLRGPNDLTLAPGSEGFYFTDPGGSSAEKPIGTVHYTGPDGVTHTIARGLAFPNGIVLRPDGKELLVAESQKNRILVYPVTAPGKLGEARTLIDLPTKGDGQTDNQPDGICLDAAGNLFVAHYGMRQVQVVSPEGKLVRRYAGGNLTTSNVCFAGPQHTQLYMTGGEPGGVFRLDLGVPGLKILPPKAN
jgi:gluconolactonase